MTDQFTGFNTDFWHFFSDLKQNNNREWFATNKERYRDKVVTPISDFICAIAPKLRQISPHYNADPRPNRGSMFRIYRDVRFSKDKRPYKEHAAAQFRHRMGKDAHAPGFYVHLEAGNIRYGGGIWAPPGETLYKIRERIAHKPDRWQAVIEDKTLLDHFGRIRGDSLKRPPRDFDGDAPHMEDLKRKSFFAMKASGDSDITATAGFIDEVITTFEAATPLMHFISDAVNVEF
ncbi:MAG: TIGR02453 family protein [Alphaproteobacteria bacterium]|nr:MAG: TIGR02453 family protein [Alphaproteobacteria bacterium]